MVNVQAKIRKIYLLIIESLKSIFYLDTLPVIGVGGLRNFGDYLNIPFFELLTDKKVIKVRYSIIEKIKCYLGIGASYCLIGSIVQLSEKNTLVWGAGLITEDSKVKHQPKEICAVRGPLTRKVILENGIDCPEVFGDPALLLPLVYPGTKTVKYKLGIIPHYVDKQHRWLDQFSNNSEILIIDINTGYDWKGFVNKVLSCEQIISSSLHGLIVADAYYIPSLWTEFSNKVIGEGFKFNDYFLSVNKGIRSPFVIRENTQISEVIQHIKPEPIIFDYTKLINACPFNIDRSKIIEAAKK